MTSDELKRIYATCVALGFERDRESPRTNVFVLTDRVGVLASKVFGLSPVGGSGNLFGEHMVVIWGYCESTPIPRTVVDYDAAVQAISEITQKHNS